MSVFFIDYSWNAFIWNFTGNFLIRWFFLKTSADLQGKRGFPWCILLWVLFLQYRLILSGKNAQKLNKINWYFVNWIGFLENNSNALIGFSRGLTYLIMWYLSHNSKFQSLKMTKNFLKRKNQNLWKQFLLNVKYVLIQIIYI